MILAAQARGLRVPEDVAVLGIGNDPISCMGCAPTLSSVAIPAEQIGHVAAGTLNRRLGGQEVESLLLPPGAVVERESTDTVGVKDPVTRRAIAFIRANSHLPIAIPHVAAHVGISYRGLEYRFRKQAGCTVHEELTRCRLDRATELLSGSTAPIKRIAHETGRMKIQNFSRFIKHHTGLSPTEYRAQHRGRQVQGDAGDSMPHTS
jgi:LacI family transcriptional regulator